MNHIITCILIALALFFFEIFVPGGILGIFGGLSLLAAVYFSYESFGIYGAIVTFFISCIIGLSFFYLEIILLSKTKLGNKFLLKQTQEGNSCNVNESNRDLMNHTGICMTTLAPTGKVIINGQTLEASSQSALLKKGTHVRVVDYDNFKLIVTAIDSDK